MFDSYFFRSHFEYKLLNQLTSSLSNDCIHYLDVSMLILDQISLVHNNLFFDFFVFLKLASYYDINTNA